MNAYADKVYATEIALDVSTSDAQAIVDAQDAEIATLRAERDALRDALQKIDMECDRMQAAFNAQRRIPQNKAAARNIAYMVQARARAALARCKS